MSEILDQIRSIKPEYKSYSDEELIPILHKRYTPNAPISAIYNNLGVDNPNDPGAMSDFAYTATGAANRGLAGIARTVDTLIGDGVDGEFINRLEENARYDSEQLSGKQQRANQKEFISSNPDETFGDAWTDPRAYLNVTGQAVGSMGPILAGGGLIGGALKKGAAAIAGEGLLSSVAGAAGYGATETAMVTGGVAKDIQDSINAMPDEVIAESPRMRELFSEKKSKGLSDREAFDSAKAELGREVGVAGMKDVALPSLLLGTVAGRFLDNALAGKLVGSRLKNVAIGAATEGITEGAQGGTEQYITQSKLAEIDKTIDPMAGVANAVVTEGIGGGVPGGLIGSVSRIAKAESVDEAISEAGKALDTEVISESGGNDKPAEQNIDVGGTEGTNAAEFDAAGVELPADDELRQPIEKPAEQFSQSTLSGAESLGDVGADVLESAAVQNLTDDETREVINYLLDVKAKKEAGQSGLASEKAKQNELENLVEGIDAGQNNDAVINDGQEQDAGQRFEKPEFKIIPDAEKIIQNRSVKGIDLRQFIDDREINKNSYNPLAGTYEKPQYKINEQKETQSEKAPVTKEFKPTHTDETGEQYQFLTGDQYLDENGEQWTFEPEELDVIEKEAKTNDAPVVSDDSQVSEQAQQAVRQDGGNNPLSRKSALDNSVTPSAQVTASETAPVPVDEQNGGVPIDTNELMTKDVVYQNGGNINDKTLPHLNPQESKEILNVDPDKLNAGYLRGRFGADRISNEQAKEIIDSVNNEEKNKTQPVSPNARADKETNGMVDGNSEEGQTVSNQAYQKVGDIDVDGITVPVEFVNKQKIEVEDADGNKIKADAKVLLKEFNGQIKALESFIECVRS